jgi:Xaa-Pro aminopeptidase
MFPIPLPILTLPAAVGVYVPADPQFPKHFHGLGMRIEDEVLVGAEHPVVLSANAPKEVCHSRIIVTFHAG